jgi:hypothetical protein
MDYDIIKSKRDLLQEQIDNLEKSGFFTEREMDRQTVSLRSEMCFLDFQIQSLEKKVHEPHVTKVIDGLMLLRQTFQNVHKKVEIEIYKRINTKEHKI